MEKIKSSTFSKVKEQKMKKTQVNWMKVCWKTTKEQQQKTEKSSKIEWVFIVQWIRIDDKPWDVDGYVNIVSMLILYEKYFSTVCLFSLYREAKLIPFEYQRIALKKNIIIKVHLGQHQLCQLRKFFSQTRDKKHANLRQWNNKISMNSQNRVC